MPSRKLKWCIGVIFVAAVAAPSLATHLRSVEIQVKRENCSLLTVEIVITAYVNSQSPVMFGGEGNYLRFGDGTSQLIPETASEIIDAENPRHVWQPPDHFTD